MIHIVFNDADVKVLQEAIALDDILQGEVIQIKDDYAVGPLNNIYVGEGIEERKRWWHDVLIGGEYEGSVESGDVDDYKTAASLVGALRRDEEETIWIWAAQNKHDVCGYYWLLNYMKEFQGRAFILYLNNLPFINEKGNIFYPDWLHQIPAKEFLKAKKLSREITPSEFEVDPDEWTKLCEENKGVRLLEGGKKIMQMDYDFYDAELKKYVTGEWQKASKIINNFLSKAKNTTGDAYLLWRLKTLAAQQVFETQGGVKNVKDLEFKINS
jgi:Protein of unknown function/Domain of unknown function (DUF1835)